MRRIKEDPLKKYHIEVLERAKSYQKNKKLQDTNQAFLIEIVKAKYAYNFYWLGVPILQIPQDLQAWQEIIWEVMPDLIIETGIAMGGSLIFNASMLAILEVCGKIEKGHVLGIDIEIRPHNKKSILAHPLSNKIKMIEGSSIDDEIIEKVRDFAKGKERILVYLDSNHTHNHVLAELRAYAPLVSVGSYCIVGDTGIENTPDEEFSARPWGKESNPKTAVWAYLKENSNFEIDKNIESKLILTASTDGYLRRIK